MNAQLIPLVERPPQRHLRSSLSKAAFARTLRPEPHRNDARRDAVERSMSARMSCENTFADVGFREKNHRRAARRRSAQADNRRAASLGSIANRASTTQRLI